MRDLRDESGVALATITAIEGGQDHRASTADRIVQTFADHGVEITNGDATGARLLLDLTRSEAHELFEEIVNERAYGRAVRDDWARVLRVVEVRAANDILPGSVARAIADIADGPEPSTYRDGVAIMTEVLTRDPSGARKP